MLETKSPVVKRSIVIAGHKTSVSLEAAFWNGPKDIAAGRRISLSDLVGAIDAERQHGNLSSAIRLFVLEHYQTLSDLSRQAEDRHELLLAPACERPESSTTHSPGINRTRIN